MKHKHYDMIVAKAANMDLVVFFNPSFGSSAGKWEEATTTLFPAFHPETDYFLCLPQHKEACLHWLNGEKSQVEYTQASYPYWCDIDSDESNWSEGHIFMDELLSIRIKPKKEKRWIGVSKSSCHTTGHYETKEEAINTTESQPWASAYVPWQFIEIEIEVTE